MVAWKKYGGRTFMEGRSTKDRQTELADYKVGSSIQAGCLSGAELLCWEEIGGIFAKWTKVTGQVRNESCVNQDLLVYK